jgi:hypothetical protein
VEPASSHYIVSVFPTSLSHIYVFHTFFSYRFCFCFCCSCLFLIARFLPFIGHTGIADSRGAMHDFQGSYYVYSGNNGMAFGAPTRYLKIDIGDLPGGAERWVRYDDAARIHCSFVCPVLYCTGLYCTLLYSPYIYSRLISSL